MAPPEFSIDVVVVGSGPAGVSAAFPLLAAGKQVAMVDGGRDQSIPIPRRPYIEERRSVPDQWKWLIGTDYWALRKIPPGSPKLRAPTHAHVFEGFTTANRIRSTTVSITGSLAAGGLSNAWGAGVAALSPSELRHFPCPSEDMRRSYERVARRIGISGCATDDLCDYFGVDAWGQSPVDPDELGSYLLARYSTTNCSEKFRLGRSRIAVVTRQHGERQACNLLGNCFWGCARKSIYDAAQELSALKQYPNFTYIPGFVVENLTMRSGTWLLQSRSGAIRGRKIVLAAGTLATTRLVLSALRDCKGLSLGRRRLQSSPTAAFLLWVPRFLGRKQQSSFGLGQLSFALKLADQTMGFGSTFALSAVPASEFVEHMPLGRRYAIDLLRAISSSCLIGNLFLPGDLSEITVELASDGWLDVKGGYAKRTENLLQESRIALGKEFRRLKALLLPRSFVAGPPGGDIHYSSTIPMQPQPAPGESFPNGGVCGLPNLFIADGACLPLLTEKSHTLTIMANADRIGHLIAKSID